MRRATFCHAVPVALAAILSAPAARADTLIARCDAGEGASFLTSAVDASGIALTLGIDLAPPPTAGATLVFRDDAAPTWSTAAPREIHADCGGEGTPVIDLFPAFTARNGTWQAQVTGTEVTGCPASVASAAAGASGGANSTAISWPQPFSPAPLFSGHGRFRQTGLMRWRGVIDRQASDAIASSVIVYLTVRSETRIEGRSVMTLRFAPMLAQMLGGTETCRAVTTAIYEWQG